MRRHAGRMRRGIQAPQQDTYSLGQGRGGESQVPWGGLPVWWPGCSVVWGRYSEAPLWMPASACCGMPSLLRSRPCCSPPSWPPPWGSGCTPTPGRGTGDRGCPPWRPGVCPRVAPPVGPPAGPPPPATSPTTFSVGPLASLWVGPQPFGSGLHFGSSFFRFHFGAILRFGFSLCFFLGW